MERPLIRMRPKVCGEIQYIGYRNGQEIGWVHSDVCPKGHDPRNLDKAYRELLHRCLDEWLDKAQGSGHFYVGDSETIHHEDEDQKVL